MYTPNPKIAQALVGPQTAMRPNPMAMVGQPMAKPAVMPATSGFAATSLPMPPNIQTMMPPAQLPPAPQSGFGGRVGQGGWQGVNQAQRVMQPNMVRQGPIQRRLPGQGGMGSQTPGGQGGGFQGGWA